MLNLNLKFSFVEIYKYRESNRVVVLKYENSKPEMSPTHFLPIIFFCGRVFAHKRREHRTLVKYTHALIF